MATTLAYSTSTDGTLVNNVEDDQEIFPVYEHEPHCYVCGRHTDHAGEHDDLVDEGRAYYTEDGDVKWSPEALADCDHGRDYTVGNRVQSPGFTHLWFVTCNQCGQNEMIQVATFRAYVGAQGK